MATGQKAEKETDTLRILRELAASKAEKEVVNFEFSRIKEQITDLKGQVGEAAQHQCQQTELFSAVGDRITALKGDIDLNSTEIRRIYTWQAGVGVSLLVFFMTIGVAAFRFVDGIDFAVKDHTSTLLKIEEQIEEQTKVRAVDEKQMRSMFNEFLAQQSKLLNK
jgi:hypothetical protein